MCIKKALILQAMLPHQRVNHFPRSYELTRKDRLYQNIERLQHAKGSKYFNFVPKTFMIPAEYSEFAATHHRMRGAWIVKPVASSRGRGIFIVSHPNQVCNLGHGFSFQPVEYVCFDSLCSSAVTGVLIAC